MAIRLQDIANDLGISKVTVSKVLRNSPDVGQETRERVKKRARELGYQPNYQARALAGGKTYSIGLIVPDLVHPFFAEIAKGLASVAREGERVLLLGSSEEDPTVEKLEIKALLQRGIDALLIASCQTRFRLPASLTSLPPCVLVDRNFTESRLDYVGSDDFRAGQIAAAHLFDIGRRRIAHIGSEAASTGRDRFRGFREQLGMSEKDQNDVVVLIGQRFEEVSDRAGYDAMQHLLARKHSPDAVFCYNDLAAVGAMAAAEIAGKRIPQDIAFVGCGNFRYADYLRVPLTSVEQSPQAIGAAAGKLALELITSKPARHQKVLLAPSLIIRESTSLQARSNPFAHSVISVAGRPLSSKR